MKINNDGKNNMQPTINKNFLIITVLTNLYSIINVHKIFKINFWIILNITSFNSYSMIEINNQVIDFLILEFNILN